jgi:hypothetical protein
MDGRKGRMLTLKDGSCIPYVTSGSYAHIFIDQQNRKVYKIFIAEPDGDLRQTSKPELDAIRFDNFKSQIDAYEIARKNEFLAAHTPAYFGLAEVAAVQDGAGNDVSHEYRLRCCYVVQQLNGSDEKLDPQSDDAPEHVKMFVQQCRAVCINYVHDASVFHRANPDAFMVIDFATREIEMPF